MICGAVRRRDPWARYFRAMRAALTATSESRYRRRIAVAERLADLLAGRDRRTLFSGAAW